MKDSPWQIMTELFKTSKQVKPVFSLWMYWYVFGGVIQFLLHLIHDTERTLHQRWSLLDRSTEGSAMEVQNNKVLDQFDLRASSHNDIQNFSKARFSLHFYSYFRTTCFITGLSPVNLQRIFNYKWPTHNLNNKVKYEKENINIWRGK